jgi:hypothetical protein
VNEQEALGIVRHLIAVGISKEDAVKNPVIPPEFREKIFSQISIDENIVLEPARFITEGAVSDWFASVDRRQWYYWPRLREFLLQQKWPSKSLKELDATTDRIMNRLPSPSDDHFDVRGLVLGFVQSGKTANFTATIAKAADCGYRLVIVLSGIDKGLRMQTQIRLTRELMGYGSFSGDNNHVPLPPTGRQWHRFTTSDLDGDFDPGNANQASLQGPEPVLLVVKKNGPVLRRLIHWLDGASKDILTEIPTLVIDDEADLASIDTRGSYQPEDEPPLQDYEPPSAINGLIRQLLNHFQKSVYIAYTATPFANILIPHDAYDPTLENDLYPKDFIVDLPKPEGYFGAEELFGLESADGEKSTSGIDVIRLVPEDDVYELENGHLPKSLEEAILGFILSGAARIQRGYRNEPTTMLIHTSHRIESHMDIAEIVGDKISEFKNEMRYSDDPSILPRLRKMWEEDFIPLTQAISPGYEVTFDRLREYVVQFIESAQVRTLNSFTGQVLDFVREPRLKAICIGGNKLSRGLTLEGLVSSYFVRDSPNYDTLMQMARWFGFRQGYVDLTRIWTTAKLSDQFALLAFVENQLRADIKVYEDMQLTPRQVGMRILKHPSMQVTSPLKRRYAREIVISQSYSGNVVQTFKFPFNDPEGLASQEDQNRLAVLSLVGRLGKVKEWTKQGPIWNDVGPGIVKDFLSDFKQSDFPEKAGLNRDVVISYINKLNARNELINWTVSIMGLESRNDDLGVTSWAVEGKRINQINRTRIKGSNSIGVVTSPGDEKIGLDFSEIERLDEISSQKQKMAKNVIAREVRSPEKGLLLIYPISSRSFPTDHHPLRVPLFEKEDDPNRRDLIALAISFPVSRKQEAVQAYLTGTAGWRPYDQET